MGGRGTLKFRKTLNDPYTGLNGVPLVFMGSVVVCPIADTYKVLHFWHCLYFLYLSLIFYFCSCLRCSFGFWLFFSFSLFELLAIFSIFHFSFFYFSLCQLFSTFPTVFPLSLWRFRSFAVSQFRSFAVSQFFRCLRSFAVSQFSLFSLFSLFLVFVVFVVLVHCV
mgnify:FL=1